jgi:hypothetical protein
MKQVILFSFLGLGISPVNSHLPALADNMNLPGNTSFTEVKKEGFNISSQPSPETEKMLAVVFRNQEYCRAELKDFEFDFQYKVVSATVYFSGTNFKNVETGFINSNSLKPIRGLMDRCSPGSIVVFDKVKVMGPDKEIRTIDGASYSLH